MGKKLSEYTMGEMKEICKNTSFNDCYNGECVFANRVCRNGHMKNPEAFDLDEKIFFTDEEVETAKALAKCFGEDVSIHKKIGWTYVHFGPFSTIKIGVFPTLEKIERFEITLNDIIDNKGLKL